MKPVAEISLTSKQRAKIQSALKALEEVRQELDLKSHETVQWYLEDYGNLNIMSGGSHDSKHQPRHSAVIEQFDFRHATGGAW